MRMSMAGSQRQDAKLTELSSPESTRLAVLEHEVKALQRRVEAADSELRTKSGKLDEARAAINGHEFRLGQWMRNFDDASRASERWREAASEAEQKVEKLSAELAEMQEKVGAMAPVVVPKSPTPAPDCFYDCEEDVATDGDEAFRGCCRKRPLLGMYVCQVCDDFVLCEPCHARRHHLHPAHHPFAGHSEGSEEEGVDGRDEVGGTRRL